MSKFDNDNVLLRESMGKGKIHVIKTLESISTEQDFYCVYFPIDTVLNGIAFGGNMTITAGALLAFQTMSCPAGTTLFTNIKTIGVTTGMAMCYTEEDLRLSE